MSKPSQDEWDSGVPVGPSEDEWAAGVVIESAPAAQQPGIMSDIATVGTEIGGDLLSGFQRLQGAIQSDPRLPMQRQAYESADAINRAVNTIEQQAQAADAAAGREFIGKTIRGAGRTLIPAVASAAVGGAPAAIAYGVGQTGSQAITQGSDAGLTGGQQARYVGTQMIAEGVPSAVMGRLGWGGLESVFSGPAKRGILNALLKAGVTIGQELPEEWATGLAQAASNKLEGVDPNALTQESIESAFYDITAQTILAAGAGSGIASVAGAARGQQEPPSPQAQAPDLNVPPNEPEFTEEELMALFADEQIAPQAGQTPFPPVEGQQLPVSAITPTSEAGTPFPGVPMQPQQTTAAPAIEAVEPVLLGPQWDRKVSPVEALGMLIGVDMSQQVAAPANKQGDIVDTAIEAMTTRPSAAKPAETAPKDTGVRAVEALYQLAQAKGEMTPAALDDGVSEYLEQFEPSERRQALNFWADFRDKMDSMTPEQQDAWADLTLGRNQQETTNEEGQRQGQGQAAEDVLAPEAGVAEAAPVTTAPVEALPEALPTPTPVQSEIVAPRAAQEPISATVEPVSEPVQPVAKPKRTPPPAKGSTSATGWSTVAKGVARKDIMGSTVEIVRQADGSWSVTRDEKEMDSGYKSRAEAEKYADGELAQDIRDQVLADEETQSSGPAPADTGIFRDLTAAARAGQRFVEDLHVRVAPTLARIHAAAKSPVEFIKQAVAKIGSHIRPYARRFLADVRKVGAEFAANPTRGSVPVPGKKDINAEYRQGAKDVQRTVKAEKEMSSAEAKAEEKEASKDAQEREFVAGVRKGVSSGIKTRADEAKELVKKIRELVPPEKADVRFDAMKKIASNAALSNKTKTKRVLAILEEARDEVARYEAVKSLDKAVSKVKRSIGKMEPTLRESAEEILSGFSRTKPSDASIAKAEALLLAATDPDLGVSAVDPKAVRKAESLVESFVSGNYIENMSLEQIYSLRNMLERIQAMHDGGAKKIIEAQLREKVLLSKTAAEIEENLGRDMTEEDRAITSKMAALKNTTKSTVVMVGEIGPEGSEIEKRLVSNMVEGDRVRAKISYDAHEAITEKLLSLGLIKKGSKGAYEATRELLEMSDSLSGFANRSRFGVWAYDKLEPLRLKFKGFEKISSVRSKYQNFETPNGVVRLTPAERMFIYNLSKDPYARHQLFKKEGGGDIRYARNKNIARKMTPALMRDVIDSLSAKERAVADFMFDYNNGKLRDTMNDFWNREYGHDVFTETDHQSYRRLLEDKDPDRFGKEIAASMPENLSILKSREGGDSPIIIEDAFAQWFAHINKTATIVGKMKPTMDARRALDNKYIKQAIVSGHKNGEKLVSDLKARVKKYGDISPSGVDSVEGWARYLLRNWVGMSVGTSITANLTTPMSVFSAQSEIPMKYIKKAIGVKAWNENAFEEIKRDSPTMYFIITDTGHNIIDTEAAGMGLQRFYGNQTNDVVEAFTSGIRLGNDKVAFELWEAAKLWGKDMGLKGEELREFTARTTEKAYSRSQPDNNWATQSGVKLQARDSLWAALRSTYQGQTQKAYNQALEARNKYRWSKKTAADKAKLANDVFWPVIFSTLGYTATNSVIGIAMAALMGDEEKEEELKDKIAQDMFVNTGLNLAGMVPGMPIVSSLARAGYYAADSRMQPAVSDDPLSSMAESLTTIVYEAVKGFKALLNDEDYDPKKARKAALKASQALRFPGKPLDQAFDILENYAD